MSQALVDPCRAAPHLYLVAEENENAPRALVEEAVDLIGRQGQELCQFPHQLYSTEFIQRNLLIKAWDVSSTRAGG